MAKHNKWSKVKRLKAVTDSRRGKVFSRLSRDITLAAKSGGGDPEGNARLRTLVLKAREANMPADNIDRAIKKGTGELPGVVYEEITYEGYGPGGVAFVVQFLHAGQFLIAKDKTNEDALMELALAAGADDVITTDEGFEVRCALHAFDKVALALEKNGIKPDSAELAYIPTTTVPVTDPAIAEALENLHATLEEFDDVQQVFSNEETE